MGKSVLYLLDDAQRYSQTTKEICQELATAYLDIFNEWLGDDYQKYLAADGLHANPEGHRYTFEAVKTHLLKTTRPDHYQALVCAKVVKDFE